MTESLIAVGFVIFVLAPPALIWILAMQLWDLVATMIRGDEDSQEGNDKG